MKLAIAQVIGYTAAWFGIITQKVADTLIGWADAIHKNWDQR